MTPRGPVLLATATKIETAAVDALRGQYGCDTPVHPTRRCLLSVGVFGL